MKKFFKKHAGFFVLGIFLIAWSVLFFYVDIRTIVDRVGVANGYLIAIAVALVGGLSAATTASFYTTIGVLVVGGLNPVFLALVVAPFLVLGDYVFYVLGKNGKFLLGRNIRFLSHVQKQTDKKSKIIPSFFIFLYGAFTPLPSDILMVLLALVGYPFKYVAPVAFVAHFTFMQIVAMLALGAISLLG